MITGLLAGAAKTMVVSMLSETVVLRVLLMLAEWASAKSTTTIDDKIVTEIRTKLEAVLGMNQKNWIKLWVEWTVKGNLFHRLKSY